MPSPSVRHIHLASPLSQHGSRIPCGEVCRGERKEEKVREAELKPGFVPENCGVEGGLEAGIRYVSFHRALYQYMNEMRKGTQTKPARGAARMPGLANAPQ
jgi:hypothetical protein